MNCPTQDPTELIPRPGTVRAELARSVREARRLRSLLRLALQAEEDRRYLRSLTDRPTREAGSPAGVAH
jgi:hypothetical protein